MLEITLILLAIIIILHSLLSSANTVCSFSIYSKVVLSLPVELRESKHVKFYIFTERLYQFGLGILLILYVLNIGLLSTDNRFFVIGSCYIIGKNTIDKLLLIPWITNSNKKSDK